ncbi:MAG TPA: hypothetical protein PLH38_04520 [Clostridia bacterium]|nr:hypothetical protein [Clostridia bacterium]
MDKDIKRYYKQLQHGGRSLAARIADAFALRLVFAAASYLWFRYNIENHIIVILLTATTTLIFMAALKLWNEISFDRFVQKESERLLDTVLRERLLLLDEGEFLELCECVCRDLPGFENATLWCMQHSLPIDADDVLAAYRRARRQNAQFLAICSLSGCTQAASALLLRLPIRSEYISPDILLRFARQTKEFSVGAEDVNAHIRSRQSVVHERRKQMQAEPFAPGRAKKYLVCALILAAASFITGYALYYRLLAGLCLMLAGTSFTLNQFAPIKAVEQ